MTYMVLKCLIISSCQWQSVRISWISTMAPEKAFPGWLDGNPWDFKADPFRWRRRFRSIHLWRSTWFNTVQVSDRIYRIQNVSDIIFLCYLRLSHIWLFHLLDIFYVGNVHFHILRHFFAGFWKIGVECLSQRICLWVNNTTSIS